MSVRISIGAQIAEIERELRMRAQVYPGRVAAGKMRQEDADDQAATMRAALSTLQVVERNADGLRILLGFLERKRAEVDDVTGLPGPLPERMPDASEVELLLQQPEVRAVLDAFPGATIASIKAAEVT